MTADELSRFRPTRDLVIPDGAMYLIVDVDTGADMLNIRPDDAPAPILAGGRTPLSLDEGLAVATQHPDWLSERNCFEMFGSRAGDRRVTSIWLSKVTPRLGWRWGGSPNSWLGTTTAAKRIG